MRIDVTLSATLEVDDETWYEAVEAFDGNEEDALYEMVNELEYSDLDSTYGTAWVDGTSAPNIIDGPGPDKRPI